MIHHRRSHPYPDLRGPEGVKRIVTRFRDGFPDIEWTVENVIEEGDYVAVRWIARGTHRGEFQGIPPTDEEVKTTGISMMRFDDGQVAEGWTNLDELGLLRQIGVVEPPAGEPPTSTN